MLITKISFETDEGKRYEISDPDVVSDFFNHHGDDNIKILLGLMFTPNLSGGVPWQLITRNG